MKIIKLWLGVNKSGFISLHKEQPTKDEVSGVWRSTQPFCNSIIQKQIEDMVKNANLNWFSDCEYIELEQHFSSEETPSPPNPQST